MSAVVNCLLHAAKLCSSVEYCTAIKYHILFINRASGGTRGVTNGYHT